MTLHVSSTVVLIIRGSKLYYTASGIVTLCRQHNSCFIISLFHASTCFEHYVLIIRWQKLYYTASGIVTPCRCTNSCFIMSLLYASTCFEHIVVHCTHSNVICNAGLLTAVSQPALHIPVYSEKRLMMDTGTARNTQSFNPKINLRNQCIQLVLF